MSYRNKYGLTEKQEAFCQAIVSKQMTQSDAYRSAYDSKEMSDKTIHERASVESKKDKVATRIRQLKNARQARYEATHDRIAQEFSRLAFGNMADLLDDSGKLKPLSELTDDQKVLIKEIKTSYVVGSDDEVRQVDEYKAHDKVGALRDLGKHTGFYEIDNAQKTGEIKSDEENEALYQKLMANQKTKQDEVEGRGERIAKEVEERQKDSGNE